MPRLLIIKPSSLGDIVHGLQVAAAWQEHDPALAIDWVARDLFAPLVEQATFVNRVYRFDRRGGGRGLIRLLRELREVHYDWVFDQGRTGGGEGGPERCAGRRAVVL